MWKMAPGIGALAVVGALAGCGSGSTAPSASPLPMQTSDCRDWRSASDAVRTATTRYDLDGLRSQQAKGAATGDQITALTTATTTACAASDQGYATVVSTQSRLVLANVSEYLG